MRFISKRVLPKLISDVVTYVNLLELIGSGRDAKKVVNLVSHNSHIEARSKELVPTELQRVLPDSCLSNICR